MIRTSRQRTLAPALTAALAMTLATAALAMVLGTAAMAQQTPEVTTGSEASGGTASGGTASGETTSGETATVGAPASAASGLNAVYSTKSMMGISTGSSTSSGPEGDGDAAAGEGDQPASE